MATKAIKKTQQTKKKDNHYRGGRNPVADPKIQVSFWIQTSHVTKLGGMDGARKLCISAMEKANPIKQ